VDGRGNAGTRTGRAHAEAARTSPGAAVLRGLRALLGAAAVPPAEPSR